MKSILKDIQVLVEKIIKTQIQKQFSTLKHNGLLSNEKKS